MKTCNVCDSPLLARGYCAPHYKRFMRHGDPFAGYIRGSNVNLEDVKWMADTGESLDGAAARIGIKPGSLKKNLSERGEHELLRQLRRRNPLPIAS